MMIIHNNNNPVVYRLCNQKHDKQVYKQKM